MSTLVDLQESRSEPAPIREVPLDEAIWRAWLARCRAREQRGSEARMTAAKWFTVSVLLAAGALWSHPTAYDVVVRFVVMVAAILVMFQAVGTRNYAMAAIFGALAFLYNPVMPTFSFSGDWQRVLVVASAIPFVASLPSRNERTKRNGSSCRA
jgi:K+-sensing histidine kinase KdpD